MTEESKLDAVRLAREKLGDAAPPEVAAFVQQHFGVTLQPAIVAVLLASLREKEHLEAGRKKGHEAVALALAELAQQKKPRRKGGPKT